MASELYVETLKGLTSGANANKVIIPSGQTLDASAGGFTTPAGHVLQVVQTEWSGSTLTSTNGTPFDIGNSISITPSSTDNKILVIAEAGLYFNNGNSTAFPGLEFLILRGATVLKQRGGYYHDSRGGGTQYGQSLTRASMNYLDSPNTTSSVTYKVQLEGFDVSGGPSNKGNEQGGSITLMEIAG